MNNSFSGKIALRGLLIALAFVLSWVEMQIPYFFTIPGIKLGLTNLVVLIALYKLSAADAFILNVVRILLVSFTFGNMAALMYSLAGGILSFLTMYLLKCFTKSSVKIVSVMGGITHNIGQLIVAAVILKSAHVFWYLPYLWISGILAGIVIGLISDLVLKKLPNQR